MFCELGPGQQVWSDESKEKESSEKRGWKEIWIIWVTSYREKRRDLDQSEPPEIPYSTFLSWRLDALLMHLFCCPCRVWGFFFLLGD